MQITVFAALGLENITEHGAEYLIDNMKLRHDKSKVMYAL